MGAELHIEEFDGNYSTEEIRKVFQNRLEELRYDHGNGGYTGTWIENSGLKITNKTFNTTDEAHEYIADNADKWEEILAVRALVVVQRQINFPSTQSDKKLHDNHQELSEKLRRFDRAIVDRVKAGKSKLKTCEHCDSRIAAKHLRGIFCPVCQKEFLLTATDHKNKKALETKAEALKDKIEVRRKILIEKAAAAAKKTGDYRWVLGGWCSC